MSHVRVEGVVAVIEHEGRLLAIRRAAGIAAGGSWCLPGGAVEPGETLEQALVREVQEEVGLSVRPLRQVWEWTRPDGRLRLHWWLAEVCGSSVQMTLAPSEVAEARWVSREDFRRLSPVLESNIAFLDYCERCRQTPPATGTTTGEQP
jgi:8-oxo-dGTP diphosphatase